MRKKIKTIGKKFIQRPIKRVVTDSLEIQLNHRIDALERNLKFLNLYLLRQQYSRDIDLDQRTTLRGNEFKVFSQNGEDGILLYMFSKIGTTNRTFVEFGIQNGKECNTANLSLNFGWNGLLMDCDENCIAKAKEYYNPIPRVKIAQHFITAENINKILLENEVKGEIDLLSVDIDGNDYWVFKAINAVKPRVVMIEYNAVLGTDKSLTVDYDPNFVIEGHYYGASLPALAKLANSKGYRLVGCESSGTNSFFLREDLLSKDLHEVSVEEAYYPSLYEKSMSYYYELVKDRKWTEV